jgi:ABC-type sugar transport system ATPase subunit
MALAAIRLRKIAKRYANGVEAVKRVSLDINDGELLVILGPPGSGKSTLLKLIAGVERPSEGELRIRDELANQVPAMQRDVATVFAGLALYPHMTVRGNLSFALRLAKVPRDEVQRRVEAVSTLLDLTELLNRKPAQISGLERQRVAIGRALIRQPSALLIDEPSAELGGLARDQMHSFLARLRERQGTAAVYVTRDQNEAASLADRVVLMANGAIEQVGPSDTLIDHPATLRVASYLSSPSMSFLRGQLDGAVLRSRVGSFLLPAALQLQLESPPAPDVVVRINDSRGLAAASHTGVLAEAEPGDLLSSLGMVQPHTLDRLTSHAEGSHPVPFPFDSADLQIFSLQTGRNVTDLVARATAGASVPEDATEGAPLGVRRSANAWLVGAEPPLRVNVAATVGFNVGAFRPGTLASAAFAEPDWGAAEQLELLVMLWANRAAVEPPGHTLILPRNGETKSVEFHVTPQFPGKLRLRFRIYLARQGVLLQELKVDVPVVREPKMAIT